MLRCFTIALIFSLYSLNALALNIGLKISANSNWHNWGDYILGKDLSEGLKNLGHNVFSAYIEDYYPDNGINNDIDIYMHGFVPFNPPIAVNNKKNVMYLYYPLETANMEKYKNIKNITEPYWYSLQTEIWDYDLIAVASQKYQKKIEAMGLKTIFSPQFTNKLKFFYEYDASKAHDILFVGRPGYERISAIWAIDSGFDVALYGNGWQDIAPQMFKGDYIDNNELHKYYASAKIVLNDTRKDMKESGFISNRVFDVTASGGFLISDYMEEIEYFYGDSIPMFKTKEELNELINYYLNHPEERKIKAKKAQEITLSNFTNEIIAKNILSALQTQKKLDENKYVIKFPYPKYSKEIGDYWLGLDLLDGFIKNNKNVKEYYLNGVKNSFDKDDFYNEAKNLLYMQFKIDSFEKEDDLKNKIMYLYFPTFVPERGKFKNTDDKFIYNTDASLNNALEYFDLIATPAKNTHKKLNDLGYKTSLVTQFTNPDKFKYDFNKDLETDLLFVGSTWYERESVKYAIELGYDVDVYGLNWKDKIDNKYIKGDFINNKDLNKYYSSAKIVLSDHAEDLEEIGLVINRLYDVSALGVLIISEYSPYIEEIFGDAIPMFKTKEELGQLIDFYLNNPLEREKKAKKAQKITLKKHTNQVISNDFIELFKSIGKDK